MGLNALTRRGWKKDPRGEGRACLIIAIVVITLLSLYNLLWGEWGYVEEIICIIIAIWGVFGFVMGEFLNWINKKTK